MLPNVCSNPLSSRSSHALALAPLCSQLRTAAAAAAANECPKWSRVFLSVKEWLSGSWWQEFSCPAIFILFFEVSFSRFITHSWASKPQAKNTRCLPHQSRLALHSLLLQAFIDQLSSQLSSDVARLIKELKTQAEEAVREAEKFDKIRADFSGTVQKIEVSIAFSPI
jgi:hypothetical protein